MIASIVHHIIRVAATLSSAAKRHWNGEQNRPVLRYRNSAAIGRKTLQKIRLFYTETEAKSRLTINLREYANLEN